jgi:hypothetical protein
MRLQTKTGEAVDRRPPLTDNVFYPLRAGLLNLRGSDDGVRYF